MRFTAGQLPGVFIVDIERLDDDRGFFARTWCAREFREHGLPDSLRQASISYNRHPGTLRGMHYQRPPSREGKLVRCVRGAVFDVVVDLRPGSPGFLRHESVELSADNRRAIYVPPGFAHGFPDARRRYGGAVPDDRRLSRRPLVGFPLERPGRRPSPGRSAPSVMSDRDRTYPDLHPADCEVFRQA